MPLYGYDASINRASPFHLASRWKTLFLGGVSVPPVGPNDFYLFFFSFLFGEKLLPSRLAEGMDRSIGKFRLFSMMRNVRCRFEIYESAPPLPFLPVPLPVRIFMFPAAMATLPSPLLDSLPFLPRIEMINRRDDPL